MNLQKSLLIFCLISISGIQLLAQNVNIPDSIFKSYLTGNVTINTNGDDEISVSEAAAYTGELIVNDKNIANITGIEAFTSIYRLECDGNLFTSLDVSSNTALQELMCDDCLENTSITCGSNTNLTRVECRKNPLTMLDIEDCTNLEKLYCDEIQIECLDLSTHTSLDGFSLRNSNVSCLNLANGNNHNMPDHYFTCSNNPYLSCITVDDITYSTTNWTNMDSQAHFSTNCSNCNTVTFTVIESNSQNPVPYATVTASSVDYTTDENGFVIIYDVPDGTMNYSVTYDGYSTTTGSESISGLTQIDVSITNTSTTLVVFNDPDFKALLVNDTTININEDTEIQTNEAEVYSGRITAEGLSIDDLTGIEHFVNLTNLNISYTSCTSIDLSQNTKLEQLYASYSSLISLSFSNHPNLSQIMVDNSTNLSSIDLSGVDKSVIQRLDFRSIAMPTIVLNDFTQLLSLSCYGSTGNKIDSLNLSGCTNLSSLTCNNNNLQFLDLSDCHNLYRLNCQDNNLEHLDLRNGNNINIASSRFNATNNNLSCINVDDVSYAQTNWTNIDEDVSFNIDCNAKYNLNFAIKDHLGNAIEDVLICVNDIYYATNFEGKVIFTDISGGTYKYSFYKEGYESVVDTLHLNSNRDVNDTLNAGTPDIVYIPDYNFRKYLTETTEINTNLDHEIQVSEAENFNDEIVLPISATDLTGLSSFSKIKKLDCNRNGNIKTLDLAGLDSLESLYCEWCLSITSIAFDSHPNLNYLRCYENEIKNLDVSSFPKLEKLSCSNNQLSSIDISNNTLLEYINISDNNLTQLDLTHNTLLEMVYVFDNSIEQLDLSNCPNVYIFSAQNNVLELLDLGNNSLWNFSKASASYNVTNNDLSCIDVSEGDLAFAEANLAGTDQIDNGVFYATNCNAVFRVTFQVSYKGNPVKDATVHFGSKNVVTDSLGVAYIVKVGNGTYSYSITHDDYWPLEGEAIVDGADTTVVDPFLYTNDEYINIPDTNFKQLLVNNPNINSDSDSEIHRSEAVEFDSIIDVQSSSIASMVGIEEFTHITSLNCSSNPLLTMLDVSENSTLTELTCNDCGLTTLTLSNLNLLQSINCNNNHLTSINVSQHTDLQTLSINNNLISAIDLASNSQLISLDCANNLIASLSVANCPDLQALMCQNNLLTKLNMQTSGLTASFNPLDFNATGNNLTCVSVDIGDLPFAQSNWENDSTFINESAYFSSGCFDFIVRVLEGTTPVQNAKVKFDDVYYSTNAIGEVLLTNISAGYYDLSVISDSLDSYMQQIEIISSDDIVINLSTGSPSIIYIPDYDFRTFLLNDTDINTNGDTEIQVAEATVFEDTIDANRLDIRDLTGLEYFSSLSVLKVNYNYNLSEIDLSHNINLTNFWCHHTAISTIDVSMLPALKRLAIYQCQLTSLDVSKNPLLEWLGCGFNEISELDLRNNPNLTFLNCTNNQLTRLDVRNGANELIEHFYAINNQLSCITVDNAAHSTYNWDVIDEGVCFSTLCDEAYSVTFNIDNGTTPIENAHINFDGIYYSTDALGSVTINNIGISSEPYNYSIYATGYNSEIKTLIVNKDETLGVTLSTGTPSIVYIPDYFLKSYLLSNNSINLNNDEEIQVTEAESFSGEIDLQGTRIKDQTGIEAFKYITRIIVANTPLSALDLSSNTKLIVIAAYNSDVAQLNVSNCAYLESLVAYNSEISSIDLSNNPLLNSLSIGTCQLTSLDLSACPLLKSVRVNDNNLSDMDLRNGNNEIISRFEASGNPSLSCINVSNVTFAETNFTDIDPGVTFSENCSGVLEEIYLTDETFNSGADECFGAELNIIVAGDGNDVIAENGSIINFVAGESIRFLPGTKLLAGSQVNAYITTDSTYCNTSKSETIAENIEVYQEKVSATIAESNPIVENYHVKIFPNPTHGRIMVEMSDPRSSRIYVYNLNGKVVKTLDTVLKNTIVDLRNEKKGIYFIRVSNQQDFIRKIIIQ